MAETIGGVIVVVFMSLWVIQAVLFYYLEFSNDIGSFSFTRINLNIFTIYDKQVKQKDEAVKRIRNTCLVLCGYCFVIAVVFVCAAVFFKM